jgi:hypothetical protein
VLKTEFESERIVIYSSGTIVAVDGGSVLV